MKFASSEVAAGGTAADGARKKARRLSHSSEDKKPRGRPRVEPRDETAADRRRTQIRLAQRAYRLRKETTISSLRQQTTELRDVVDDMHTALADFKKQAAAAGLETLSTSIYAELTDTEKVFDKLKAVAAASYERIPDYSEKPARGDNDDDSPEPESVAVLTSPNKKRKASITQEHNSCATVTVAAPQQSTGGVWQPHHQSEFDCKLPSSSSSSSSPSSSSSSLSSLSSASENVASSPNTVDTEAQEEGNYWDELSKSMQMDMELNTLPQVDHSDPDPFALTKLLAQPDITAGISSPVSLAWQEPSFSRQLQRATLEAGVLLIQRQILKPERFTRKFQLCLPFGDRDTILGKIKHTLRRDTSETLDWNDHPMRHLGGCGTHYARREDAGNGPPLQTNMHVTKNLGADALATLMNSANGDNQTGQTLNTAGFEGEWFDAQDVEGYLEHRGLHIEPGSNIAVFEPRKVQADGRVGSPSASLDGLDFLSLANSAPSSKTSRHTTTGRRESSQQGSSGQWSGEQTLLYNQTSAVPQKRAFVDVATLLRELIRHATCLGRAPGYRRRDVDRAINLSLSLAS